MTIAEKVSLTSLPLLFPTIIGWGYFTLTLILQVITWGPMEVCWEAGILGTVGGGFIILDNFNRNAHSEHMDAIKQSK
jgi:hypothetical protein